MRDDDRFFLVDLVRQSIKGLLVHAFWLGADPTFQTKLNAKPAPDFSCLTPGPVGRAFSLARIGEVMTRPAQEQFASTVEVFASGPAIRAEEQASLSAVMTGHRNQVDKLFNRMPLAAIDPIAKDQLNPARFG